MASRFLSLAFLFCILSPFAFAHRNQGVPLEYVKASYLGKNGKDTLRLEMKFSEPGTISSLRFFTGDLDIHLGSDDLKVFREYRICGFGVAEDVGNVSGFSVYLDAPTNYLGFFVAISKSGTYRVEKLRDSIHFKGQSMRYAEYKKKTKRTASPGDCLLLALDARYDLGLALGKMEMSADFRNSAAFWVTAFGRRENVLEGRTVENVSSVSLWRTRSEIYGLRLSEERFEIPVSKSVRSKP